LVPSWFPLASAHLAQHIKEARLLLYPNAVRRVVIERSKDPKPGVLVFREHEGRFQEERYSHMLFQTKRYTLLLERVDKAEHRLADLEEQQRQFNEGLMQRQTHSEQEVVTLRETFTKALVDIRKIVEPQRGQQESLVSLTNENHQQLDQLRKDLVASLARQGEIEALLERHAHDVEDALKGVGQRFEQIGASLEQLARGTQSLEGMTLALQQRAEAQEQPIATLVKQLQEEVRAREKLAQQVVSGAGPGTTQPRRKPRA
jgi:chromosome segregation ATPase